MRAAVACRGRGTVRAEALKGAERVTAPPGRWRARSCHDLRQQHPCDGVGNVWPWQSCIWPACVYWCSGARGGVPLISSLNLVGQPPSRSTKRSAGTVIVPLCQPSTAAVDTTQVMPASVRFSTCTDSTSVWLLRRRKTELQALCMAFKLSLRSGRPGQGQRISATLHSSEGLTGAQARQGLGTRRLHIRRCSTDDDALHVGVYPLAREGGQGAMCELESMSTRGLRGTTTTPTPHNRSGVRL